MVKRRSDVRGQILLELKRNPRGIRRASMLAERLGVLRSSASRAVNQLEREGQVERKHGRWQLTDAGQKMLPKDKRSSPGVSRRELTNEGAAALDEYMNGQISGEQLVSTLRGGDREALERAETGAPVADSDSEQGEAQVRPPTWEGYA